MRDINKEIASQVSNLIFISGDFSSGTTLLWTLFRRTGDFHCLYEPLHERLLEYLIWPLRVYEHHFFVKSYFAEYKGFRAIPELFDPQWGNSNLHLSASAQADPLYRYLTYLIGMSFTRSERVVLQFNRATFRLGWLRDKFPTAKIVHICRNREDQWNSIVRRAQRHVGKLNVGQDDVTFNGMNIANWCDDLQSTYPQLAPNKSKSGYERFSKLWELSMMEHKRYADVSLDYAELTGKFQSSWQQIAECVNCDVDPRALENVIVPPEKQGNLGVGTRSWRKTILRRIDDIGFRQARVRIRLRRFLNRRKSNSQHRLV